MSSSNSNIVIPPLIVATFNILAPVYKRLESESHRESENDKLWKPRHSHIIELLKSTSAHILCLQEFWFNQDFIQLYESDLSKEYKFFYRQRTHYADDGLVILISKQEQNGFKLEIIDRHDCLLYDVGNRVGLLLRLRLTIIDTNQTSDFLLLNLHLTFPHNSFDRNLRFEQIKALFKHLKDYQHTHQLEDCSVVLCGDFNSAAEGDSVYDYLTNDQHYISSYKELNNKEPNVTHLTHLGTALGVDFIFYRNFSTVDQKFVKFKPITSYLIPHGSNEQKWDRKWDLNGLTTKALSDHRMIVTHFKMIL